MEQTTTIYSFLNSLFIEQLNHIKLRLSDSFNEHLGVIVPTLLIIAIIIFGYRVFLFGVTQKEAIMTILKLVFVATVFSVAVSTFSIIDTGVSLLSQFVTEIVPFPDAESSYAQLDEIIKKTMSAAREITKEASKVSIAGILSLLFLVGAFIVTAMIFMMITVIDFFLAILVAIGLLFILLLLFESTQSYFKDWFKAILSLLLTKLIIMVIAYFIIRIFSSIVINGDMVITTTIHDGNLGNTDGVTHTTIEYNWGRIGGLLAWEIVSFVLVLFAPKLANTITAGMGMAVADAHRPLTNIAKDTARFIKTKSAKASHSFKGSNNSYEKGVLTGAATQRDISHHDMNKSTGKHATEGALKSNMPIHTKTKITKPRVG